MFISLFYLYNYINLIYLIILFLLFIFFFLYLLNLFFDFLLTTLFLILFCFFTGESVRTISLNVAMLVKTLFYRHKFVIVVTIRTNISILFYYMSTIFTINTAKEACATTFITITMKSPGTLLFIIIHFAIYTFQIYFYFQICISIRISPELNQWGVLK